MITAEFFSCVFRVKFRDRFGTAFFCKYYESEYLVTAEHIVKDAEPSEMPSIQYNQDWHDTFGVKIGVGSDYDEDYDVAVFRVHQFSSTALPVSLGIGGAIIGDDTYFLGFPYEMVSGRMTSGGELPRARPMPLVKKATFSGHNDDIKKLVLDGHNNPGFSGGPVLIKPHGHFPCTIGGVISGYRKDYSPVMNCESWFKETGLMAEGNSGIIFVTSSAVIKQIIDEKT